MRVERDCERFQGGWARGVFPKRYGVEPMQTRCVECYALSRERLQSSTCAGSWRGPLSRLYQSPAAAELPPFLGPVVTGINDRGEASSARPDS